MVRWVCPTRRWFRIDTLNLWYVSGSWLIFGHLHDTSVVICVMYSPPWGKECTMFAIQNSSTWGWFCKKLLVYFIWLSFISDSNEVLEAVVWIWWNCLDCKILLWNVILKSYRHSLFLMIHRSPVLSKVGLWFCLSTKFLHAVLIDYMGSFLRKVNSDRPGILLITGKKYCLFQSWCFLSLPICPEVCIDASVSSSSPSFLLH